MLAGLNLIYIRQVPYDLLCSVYSSRKWAITADQVLGTGSKLDGWDIESDLNPRCTQNGEWIGMRRCSACIERVKSVYGGYKEFIKRVPRGCIEGVF